MAKYTVGFAVGALVVLLVIYFFYPRTDIKITSNTSMPIDSLRTNDIASGLIYEEYIVKMATNEEKIASLNTRFNDLYILGGIISMFLLAIVATVYVKADSDVKKHLSENFSTYKDQVLGYVTEAEQMVEKGRTEFEFMSKLRQSMEEDLKMGGLKNSLPKE
jgi:hypothetical protein